VHLCARTRPDPPEHFDLTVNTEKMPVEPAAALVAQAARSAVVSSRRELGSTRDIPADPVLDELIGPALAELP
jgi:hypothetical protein